MKALGGARPDGSVPRGAPPVPGHTPGAMVVAGDSLVARGGVCTAEPAARTIPARGRRGHPRTLGAAARPPAHRPSRGEESPGGAAAEPTAGGEVRRGLPGPSAPLSKVEEEEASQEGGPEAEAGSHPGRGVAAVVHRSGPCAEERRERQRTG